jgi:serine beta-lactamase-like protein LACTB
MKTRSMLILYLAILVGMASTLGDISGQTGRIPPSQASGAKGPRGIPKTAAEFSGRVREVDEYLREFLKKSVVPGISVAMGVGDEFTHSEGFGFSDLASRRPVTPQTRFRIGSVSKTLTGIALGILLEEKKLDLDADVRRYVLEFPDKGFPITIRHLAYHRSGIRHYVGDEVLSDRYYKSVLDALKVFADDPLVAKPGTAFSYSTYGYTLLSAAMEQGSGQPFPDLMKENVLKPFEMTQTELEVGGLSLLGQATGYEAGADGKPEVAPKTDLSVKFAGGGFVSTAGDLLKFARALLSGHFLRKETLDLLWTPQPGRDATKATLGLGWQVTRTPNGKRLLMTGGNAIGGTAVMFVVPEEGVVLAFVANMGNAPVRGVPRKALGILLGEGGE